MDALGKNKVNSVRKTPPGPVAMRVSADTERPDKRKVRHDRKRQSYLAEAMSLVVQDGMEGLTIARLANRMNASVGAVYRYFPSKEALIVGLQELAIADFHTFMQQRLTAHEARLTGAAPDTRALARLLIAFNSYLEHADHSPRPHRLVDTFLSFPEAVLSDAEAQAVGERLIEPVLTTFVGLLADAAETRAIDAGDDLQRTHLAWAFVHGLDHFRKRDRIMPDSLRVKALLPIARGNLLRAFGAKPEAIAQAEKLLPQ